ncbi:hypothetical protein EIP91_000413 [Steccherinum ochraceum]|uniref:Uncharacterized protein n=1 Tax=Steccherinum ochraceum TaxID=92696 RepID=A0A4R0RI98_9APHY|nr:hypothetical protein EIP91_000413 [Steccherinum ochraceum]
MSTPADLQDTVNTINGLIKALINNGQQINTLWGQLGGDDPDTSIPPNQVDWDTARSGCVDDIADVQTWVGNLHSATLGIRWNVCQRTYRFALAVPRSTCTRLFGHGHTGQLVPEQLQNVASATPAPTATFIANLQDMATSAANLDASLTAAGQTNSPAAGLLPLLQAYGVLIPQAIQALGQLDQYQTAMYENAAEILFWASNEALNVKSDVGMPYLVKSFKYINSNDYTTDASILITWLAELINL